MITLRRAIILGAALAAGAAGAGAFEQLPGGAADASQSWGLGARAEALGRVYGALADDAAAAYWNPAGLAALGKTEVTFGYGRPFKEIGGINVGDAAVAKPLLYGAAEEAGGGGSLGTLAGAIAFRRVSEILEADENGFTGRAFADTDFDLYVAYAHTIGKKASLGLCLKNTTRTVAGYDDSGFGLDLGGQYHPAANFNLGLVLRNIIAPNYELAALRDAPPLTVEAAASYKFLGIVGVTAGGVLTRELFYDAGAGVEVTPWAFLALRGGYDLGDGRPRAGLGMEFDTFAFDYALRMGGALGDTHIASVSFLIPPPPKTSGESGGDEGYIEYNAGEETPAGEGEPADEPLIPGLGAKPAGSSGGAQPEEETPSGE